jgi:Na+-driven multidrug efflux pump
MTTNKQMDAQEKLGREEAYFILKPLARRAGVVSLTALALVLGVLNVVVTLGVMRAYGIVRSKNFINLMSSYIFLVGLGYILLMFSASAMIVERWGQHHFSIGTFTTAVAYILGSIGMAFMMAYQHVRELRAGEEQ